MRRAAALLLVAGCAKGTFLGEQLPRECRSAKPGPSLKTEYCVGWVMDRLLIQSVDDEYGDPAIAAYVTSVAERVARGSGLPAPTVRIADASASSLARATPGGYVSVARTLLAVLDDEAELAAVLAHEMAHQAAGHTADFMETAPTPWTYEQRELMSRDDEATADERAVEYLAAAGYAPDAMMTALVALNRLRVVVELEAEAARTVAATTAEPAGPGEVVIVGPVADTVSGAAAYADPALERIVDARRAYPPHVDPEDGSHPAIEVRVARVMRLAAGRDGERGAERYRTHVTGVVVGGDPRRVKLDGTRWSSARLGLAADLPADWETDEDGPRITLRGKKHEATLWPVGRAWGEMSVEDLEPRRRARVAGYPAVIGVQPGKRDATAPRNPRLDGNGPRPGTGAAVGVIYVGSRALLVYVDGADAETKLTTLLRGMRLMTADEHAAIRPPRLLWKPAPRAAPVRDLVPELCGHPELARWLSDQNRRAAIGDLVKCVD